MNKGLLVVYTGASGVGKGTIMKELLKASDNIRLSVSATTRQPRKGETHGVEYFFMSEDEFRKMIDDDGFLEHAAYCDNYYGTPKKAVEEMLSDGLDVFLEIEVQGGMKIKEICKDCVSIFIMPPSTEDLYERLKKRGTEPIEIIEKRYKTAQSELPFASEYDYVVINDDVQRAANEILNIIKTEKDKRNKQ